MSEPELQLPEDLESCHALTRQLSKELAQVKEKLSVYVENERREYEARYGKGVTPQSLLSVGQWFNRPPDEEMKKIIEAELAAEDAMRSRRKRRKK